jgi:hypothetical protein
MKIEIGALKAGASEVLFDEEGPSILSDLAKTEGGEMTKLGDAAALDPTQLEGGVEFEDSWEEQT